MMALALKKYLERWGCSMSSANEYSFPFGSMNGDRKYKAEEWRNVTRAMYSTGVFPVSPQLSVSAGEGMSVVISPGRACIDGVIYTLKEPLTVQLSDADGVLGRKDKIIITVDESARDTYGTKLEGTPSAFPAAPSNRWTSSYKDICLAIVTVSAGMTSVPTSGSIQNTIFETELCGIAAPYQTPDTSGWFANFEASFNEWKAQQTQDFDDWFATMVATLDENVAANLLNIINANKAELEEEIADLTPEDIGAEPSRLSFVDQSVSTSGWATYIAAAGEETKIKNNGYIYRKSLTLAGVLATMKAYLMPSEDKTACGATICGRVITHDGGIFIYAKSVPTAEFTFLSVDCFKAGD